MKKLYILFATSTAALGMQIAGPSTISGRALARNAAERALRAITNELECVTDDTFDEEWPGCLRRLTQHTLLLARCAEIDVFPEESFYDDCNNLIGGSSRILKAMIVWHIMGLAPVDYLEDYSHTVSDIVGHDPSDWRYWLDQREPQGFAGTLGRYIFERVRSVPEQSQHRSHRRKKIA